MARRRKTVARHARLGAPSAMRQLLTLVAVALGVVLVAGAGTVAYGAYSLTAPLAENAVALEDEVAQPPALGAFEGPFSLLIVGTDECETEIADQFGDRCSGPDADGQLNDVNMLVHVSDAPRRVTVVSFPRDLEIPVPSCVDESGNATSAAFKQPINSVYGVGGLNCVAKTVSSLSELQIPFAAKASFGNVINITDAIGGVEVCIGEGGLRDPEHTGIDWPEGPRTVQGMEALQFLRVRSGVGDGSDLARIGNQQQYLSSLTRKLMSDGVLGDPAALLRLATAGVRNIEPSEELSNPIRIAQLALAARDVPPSDVTFVQFPVQDDPDNPNHVVPDEAAAEKLWDALRENKSLVLTGEAGSNGGVEALPTDPPTDAPPSDTTATPEPTTVPDDAAVLSENTNGTNAEQRTCTA